MSAYQSGTAASQEKIDPEVTARAKRRSYNAAYKTKILAEVDAAADTGISERSFVARPSILRR